MKLVHWSATVLTGSKLGGCAAGGRPVAPSDATELQIIDEAASRDS